MKNLKLSVRLADIKDLQIITDFQIACAKESENRDLHEYHVGNGVARILSCMPSPAHNIGTYLVIEDDWTEGERKVAGCCLLQLQFSDWNCGYYMNVESIYIDPIFRGTGVLQELIKHVTGYVKNLGGVVEIRSTIATENTRMQKAIVKIGWKETKYRVFGADM